MIQLIVFVPKTHTEKIKQAMFKAGGGKIGNYDSCCFEHPGIGQFRPLKDSHAFLGKIGEVEKVKEVKIEMVCDEIFFDEVIRAMKTAHPYETPAYYSIKTLGQYC